MARARTIKHGFFTNDQLAELHPLVRLLFAGIWTIADRRGRLLDRPKKIKADVMPYDDLDVEGALDQLAERGFILRYEADGQSCIQVAKWDKHQKPHPREIDSELPAAPGATDMRIVEEAADDVVGEKPDLGTAEPQKGHDEQVRSPVSGPLAIPSGSSGLLAAPGGPLRAGARARVREPPSRNGVSHNDADYAALKALEELNS